MYLKGRQLQKTDRMHEVLQQVIHVSHITSTQELAQTMGLKRWQIDCEIDRMIRWGVLKDAQLDIPSAKILLPKEKWADAKVVCSECGAELIINIGRTLVCPYCKTALLGFDREDGCVLSSLLIGIPINYRKLAN